MIKFFSKQMNNKKGFTLIELVVVIAILGILMAIAVPRLLGFRQSAAERADKATAGTIGNAVMLHYANVGAEDTTIEIKDNGSNMSEAIREMIEDGDGNLPKPQYKGKNGFVAVVDDEGNVKVYYDDDDDRDNQLWPEKGDTGGETG